MVATFYNAGNSDSDFVRFLIGDTDCENALVQDEDIQVFLSIYSNRIEAAAEVAASIAAQLSLLPTREKIGNTDFTYGDRAKHFDELSARLRKQATGSAQPIVAAPGYAGGISVSNKELHADNTDNVKPAFTRGQFSYGD